MTLYVKGDVMGSKGVVVTDDQLQMMKNSSVQAAGLMKALSHPTRLLLVCQLVDGEKSVSNLVDLLDMRQSSVSQQLARLRKEGLVKTRRESQVVYYSVADARIINVITVMCEQFCVVE